jgi:hypothetical protein
MNLKIRCNEFVKRQTRLSPFSYFHGSWEMLESLAERETRLGYVKGDLNKPGVLIVPVPPGGFYSGVALIKAGSTRDVTVKCEARREGEAPFLQIEAHGHKNDAVAVDLVLYSREKLIADGDTPSTDADYEIISINARTSTEPEPMTPMAMARNLLGLPGGSKPEPDELHNYTAEKFAEAIIYWSTRAMHGGS